MFIPCYQPLCCRPWSRSSAIKHALSINIFHQCACMQCLHEQAVCTLLGFLEFDQVRALAT